MSKPVLVASVVILTIVIAGVAIWAINPNPQPPTPTTPSLTPIQTQSTGPCKDFEKVENEISCEDALSIVKKKYPGAVQEVSSGVFQKEDTSQGIATWVIEIELDKPIIRKNNTFDKIRLFLRRDTGEEFRITRGNE